LIFDVSDPAQPAQIASVATIPPSYAGPVLVQGSFAYIPEQFTLHILDIADPTQPHEVGTVPITHAAEQIAVDGPYVFTSDIHGMSIIDVSNPAAAREIGVHDEPWSAYPGRVGHVSIQGQSAFVGSDTGPYLYTISDPAEPEQAPLPTWSIAGFHSPFAADQASGRLYGLDSAYGGDFLVAAADDLRRIASHSFEGVSLRSIALDGSRIYLGYFGPRDPEIVPPRDDLTPRGLHIFDLADPMNPVLLGSLDMEQAPDHIAVAGDRVYASYSNRLRIIDVHDPSVPTIVGTFRTQAGIRSLAVRGTCAYVGDVVGLYILDVTDAANPIQGSLFRLPGPPDALPDPSLHDAVVSGRYAYLADGSRGIRILDISDPRDPVEVGFYERVGTAVSVALEGPYIFVAGQEGGLWILRFTGGK
jgi:hypothetical protein